MSSPGAACLPSSPPPCTSHELPLPGAYYVLVVRHTVKPDADAGPLFRGPGRALPAHGPCNYRIATFSAPAFTFTSAFWRSSMSTVTSGSTSTRSGSNPQAMVTVRDWFGPSVIVLRASA
jgi:hypothetical protein